ncbi:MAG TPA: hypothetical protein PK640_17335, partial [Verrucomicrobiota bacterium]|nr:hypothetical protein [Verrucomicrobiota bacterium]
AIDVIWVDALNARPRVWPAVAALLGEKFPQLRERYQRLLFEADGRASYLAQLRERVMDAAQRFSLQERITVCF